MREIKFRAWDKEQHKMYEFDLQTYMSSSEEHQEDLCPLNTHKNIMQFTGLKDKNGKEIYEGDVVEVETPHDISQKGVKVKYKVGFYNGGYVPFNFDDLQKYKVIGNIYENPELIKEE